MKTLAFLFALVAALLGVGCMVLGPDRATCALLALAVAAVIALMVRQARCPACGRLALNVNPLSRGLGACARCGERPQEKRPQAGSVMMAVVVVALLGATAFALVYTRPQTIEQRFPFLDLSQCSQMEGYFFQAPAEDDIHFVIDPDDEGFDRLLGMVEAAEFRASLATFFPAGQRMHRYADGDFEWTLGLRFEGVAFPDGSVCSGQLLRLDDFFGDLSFSFDGKVTYCALDAQARWLADVLAIISRHPAG